MVCYSEMKMRTKCSHCGTPHVLDDKQIAGQSRVQFRCSNCGQSTVLDMTAPPARTQVTTPLPAAARRANQPPVDGTVVSRGPGLALPRDKTITLSIIQGASKGLKYQLPKPQASVGRAGGGADVEINDPEVSRMHCAVEVQQELVRLRDLGSTNGTYVNEERVEAATLEHLSEFRVGSSVVLLTILPKQN